MEQTQSNVLTNEEKMIGMFSHFSIFLGGLIVPLIFWLIYKEKSKFIRFHSLQAMFFHIAFIVIIFLWVFIIIFAIVGLGLASAGSHAVTGHEAPGLFVLLMVVVYAMLFLIIFGVYGLAIYMGIKAYHGEYVKYPLIGRIVYEHIFGKT
jgi:uncharacterized Tic20 family protein